MKNMNHFDLIIMGGGLVGLSFACMLANTSLSIAVIEANDYSENIPSDTYLTRVSAINRASQQIFENIGLWPILPQSRLTPYTKMYVWESGKKTALNFDISELNTLPIEEKLGYIIENDIIRTALFKQLQHYSNIHCISSEKAEALSFDENKVQVKLSSGKVYTSNLIVAADGSNSWVRQTVGIPIHSWDYGHTAIVTNVQTELSHQNTAWQCFLPTGPLAFLPLPDPHLCSIVWSTSPEQANKVKSLPLEEVEKMLETSFEYRLGTVKIKQPLLYHPLRMQHAKHYVKAGIALIGDAAHTIHPLAGQGVNLGLLDAAALAETLLKGLKKGKNIGGINVLRPYERWRKGSNLAMIGAMEILKRTFEFENPLLKYVRQEGMGFINAMPCLKNPLIAKAMGLTGDLPALAKR
ncbi:MAG: 2-octaprenylphenol hydroxylase [Legionellaceae bacterium]